MDMWRVADAGVPLPWIGGESRTPGYRLDWEPNANDCGGGDDDDKWDADDTNAMAMPMCFYPFPCARTSNYSLQPGSQK